MGKMNTAPVITIPNGSTTCFDAITLLINKLTTNNNVKTNCKKLILRVYFTVVSSLSTFYLIFSIYVKCLDDLLFLLIDAHLLYRISHQSVKDFISICFPPKIN